MRVLWIFCRGERAVQCAVIKDGGDDPDITTGAHVVAKVSFLEGQEAGTEGRILIDGGIGVGRVTKPGTGSAGRKCGDQSCAKRDDRKGNA